ncbi:hypothetical protein BA768_18910 [Chryseobacterium sp. CBo1]|uniref:hypothetical protein n=1 Tax=Chryseobacterium sp. CBo1 TaxID=1869230 RepID=UPI00081097EF|nr:hypothetical protein [Chryseobacterium sp. CBo1]OCK50787.1 hypothetical protein BA768_18910 [Chryseobacterium sp. CBo1]
MSQLLRVKVTTKHNGENFEGKFHMWFTKGYENGETYLCAVIHNDKGIVGLYDLDSFTIEFLSEFDHLDLDNISGYDPPISAGR